MAPLDPLAALAELERRFNGPIPEPLRLLAQHGSGIGVLLLEAEGQAAFFKAMLTGQIALIRRRRRDGSFYPALLADLALYRRHWRHWRRRARVLRDLPSLRAGPLPPPRAGEGGGGGDARAAVAEPRENVRAPAES